MSTQLEIKMDTVKDRIKKFNTICDLVTTEKEGISLSYKDSIYIGHSKHIQDIIMEKRGCNKMLSFNLKSPSGEDNDLVVNEIVSSFCNVKFSNLTNRTFDITLPCKNEFETYCDTAKLGLYKLYDDSYKVEVFEF